MVNDFSRPGWPAKFARAVRGVALGTVGQSSFLAHAVFLVAVLAGGVLLSVSRFEWYILCLCITVVLAAELFNSSLEHMAKAITSDHNDHIRDALDVASGAVLVCATGAAATGSIVFVFRWGALVGWWAG